MVGADHLMPQNGKPIHGHFRLISPVDAFVPNEPGCGDHIGRHAVSDEEDDIFRPLHFRQRSHQPFCHGFGSIVVGQRHDVVTRLVQSHASVCLRCHVDDGGFFGVLGEQILIPGEIPALEFGGVDLEVFGRIDRFPTILGDGQGELFIRHPAIGFGAVHGGMDFDTNIEILPGQEVGPAGPVRIEAGIIWPAKGAHWSGGNRQPSVGQAPNR